MLNNNPQNNEQTAQHVQQTPTTATNVAHSARAVDLLYRVVEELPSGRIPYPNLELSIRPYTWAEQKALSHVSKLQDIIPIVAAGVISNIPVNQLTEGDFVWVALLRKLNTIGDSEFNATASCPYCGEQVKTTLKLADLDFDSLKAKALPIVLKGKEYDLQFSPLPVETIAKELDKPNPKDDVLLRLTARSISNLSYSEAYAIVSEADTTLGEYFERVIKLLYHSLKPIEIKCDNCGQTHELPLEPFGRSVVLTPFHEKGNSNDFSISFGN